MFTGGRPLVLVDADRSCRVGSVDVVGSKMVYYESAGGRCNYYVCVVDVAVQLSDVTEFGHRKIAKVD